MDSICTCLWRSTPIPIDAASGGTCHSAATLHTNRMECCEESVQ